MVEIKAEKDKLAIVVVGYNKIVGLTRLLRSLNDAVYSCPDIPIIISIDASGNKDVYRLANEFEWKHGVKYVNIEQKRLGLKNHIFQCASLSKYFKGVIVLEDDIFVSPYFYTYALEMLEKYGSDNRVAGISLYQEESNGFVGLPYQTIQNGSDVYAWQTVCSWGEIWNERMWNDFMSWMSEWNEDFGPIDMMQRIKNWERAWSKYYYAYMIETDKYFIYPYISLTTNFNDAGGEHGGGNSSVVQVSLLQGERHPVLYDFEDLEKYDVYGQNMGIYEWLGLNKKNLTIDLYGLKDLYRGRYVLAPFRLPYKKVRSFALSMRPIELNIKYGLTGDGITLFDRGTDSECIPPKRSLPNIVGKYFFRDYNVPVIINYSKSRIISFIRRKLHF